MEDFDNIDMSRYLDKPLDINNICRACLGTRKEMKPLFGSCLDEMLMFLTQVQIKQGDGMPNLLCLQCILQISRSYTFKKQCLKSAFILKNYMSPEFQKKLPISEETSKNITDSLRNEQLEDLIINASIKSEDASSIIEVDEFENMTMAGELILDPSGDEMKSVTLEQLNQTNFDEISVSDDMMISVKLDPLENFENTIEISSKNDLATTHILEIRPDGTAHILAKENIEQVAQDITIEMLEDDKDNQNNGEKKHKCTRCEAVFDLHLELRIHMALHTLDHYCKICNKSLTNAKSLKRHLKTHALNKPHVCNICNKTFSESSNLTKHKKIHTGELRNVVGKPHLCSVCGRSFKWATSLSKHFKYHTGKKLLSCNYCPKQYAEARSLQVHIRSHTGEKPFVCNICTKGFTQQCNLEKHIRVHLGQKPFVCTICGKAFAQKACLTVHIRTHTGERPYSCNTCGRTFIRANTLSIHQKVHTGQKPFTCLICQKSFTRNETLMIHQRSHTGEKPHVCPICTKGFASSGHLTTHMRTHTGEKPYCCTECDKKFACNSSLKLHLRSHTKVEVEKPVAGQVAEEETNKDSLLSIAAETVNSMTSSPLSWSKN